MKTLFTLIFLATSAFGQGLGSFGIQTGGGGGAPVVVSDSTADSARVAGTIPTAYAATLDVDSARAAGTASALNTANAYNGTDFRASDSVTATHVRGALSSASLTPGRIPFVTTNGVLTDASGIQRTAGLNGFLLNGWDITGVNNDILGIGGSSANGVIFIGAEGANGYIVLKAAGSVERFRVNSTGVLLTGNLNPEADGTRSLGTQTTAQWANVWADLINGADISMANKWRMVESELYGYPKGWALGYDERWEDGKSIWAGKQPIGDKPPIFVVTEGFVEYRGVRFTKEELLDLKTLKSRQDKMERFIFGGLISFGLIGLGLIWLKRR